MWCMVLEIYGVMDKMFCNFGLFFCPFTNPALDNHENQNFERMKKTTGDIIWHMCIINEDHMMYGSWDMEHKGHKFLSVWSFFRSFTSLMTQKIKILKKLKNTGDIIILHVYHKWQSYDVWYLRYGMRRTKFFDSWGGILCSFTSLATRKIKIKKK